MYKSLLMRNDLMNTVNRAMRKLILNLPRLGSGRWWVEITTAKPSCVYYFGPFPSAEEAFDMCPEYVEKLTKQGDKEIKPKVKYFHPTELAKWTEGNESA